MIVRARQTGQMDPAERSAAIEIEGRRLLDLAAAHPEIDVPACPGWESHTLVAHVAGGWEAVRGIVEAASTEPPDFGSLADAPEDFAELLAFAADRLDRLTAVIAESDPGRDTWTWIGERKMAFWPRRVHHETLIHRVDMEGAAGSRTPVAPNVGVDVVDELFSVLLAGATDGLPTGSFHLHQTDGDGEFMLDVADGRLRVRREHAKGDAALRATGEELALVMWGRRSLDGLELFGDHAVAEQWATLAP